MKSKQEMFKDLVKRVEEYKPDLLAISMLEDLFALGVEMLNAVEHLKLPVMAGGVFQRFAPEEVIKVKAVAMVCVGEGEQTMNVTKGSLLHMPQFPYEEIKGLIRTFTLYVKYPKERWPEIRVAEKSDGQGNAAFKSLQQEF